MYYLEAVDLKNPSAGNSVVKSYYVSCSFVNKNYSDYTRTHTVTNENLWHFRLGHPSTPRLQTLHQINKSIIPSYSSCDICHLAKQKKSTFPISHLISNNYFDLIHVDIWGPINVASLYGHHYFLTIVDDKRRYTWF